MSTNLTPQQEHFCKLYVQSSSGVLSYMEAYKYEIPKDENAKNITSSKEYNICNANASRLLTNDNIRATIRDLWLERFNDKEIDARTSQIAFSGRDTDSIQAIKIANDLKQRITRKLDITSGGRPLQDVSDEELERLASE